MKAIITRYSIEKHQDDSNEEFIFIHAFFRTDNHPEASKPVIFSFDNLVDFISEQDEPTGNYLKRIRYGIKGNGSKQANMNMMVEEKDFDLEPYIFQFTESKEAEYILQHLECSEEIKLPDNICPQEHHNKLFESTRHNDSFHRQITFHNFQGELDETIHEITLKYFPELMELDKQCLTAYKDKLIDLTLSFSESVDKIIRGKFDSHWGDDME